MQRASERFPPTALVRMEPLKLRTNVEYEVYGTEPDLVVEILLTVEAGALDVSERAPTSLTAVLDRSGSMAGSKLHMVLETNKFMVTQTSSCDRLSIVTYDSQVRVCLCTVCNPTGLLQGCFCG